MRKSFEDSVVASDLAYWGFWKGLQHAADGYSPSSTLAQLLSGRSDRPGHRILCLDMKPRAWEINTRVYTLPWIFIEVLTGRYCLPCKPNTGEPYRATEIADLLHICADEYIDRLRKAQGAYKRIIFPDLALAARVC